MDYKNSMYEPSTRVPMIITAYNVPEFEGGGGQVITVPTSHLDILPTLVREALVVSPAVWGPWEWLCHALWVSTVPRCFLLVPRIRKLCLVGAVAAGACAGGPGRWDTAGVRPWQLSEAVPGGAVPPDAC
jgi:hypothetical protein